MGVPLGAEEIRLSDDELDKRRALIRNITGEALTEDQELELIALITWVSDLFDIAAQVVGLEKQSIGYLETAYNNLRKGDDLAAIEHLMYHRSLQNIYRDQREYVIDVHMQQGLESAMEEMK
jgi:hypothetical protein